MLHQRIEEINKDQTESVDRYFNKMNVKFTQQIKAIKSETLRE